MTDLNISQIYLAINQYIRMNSEGSCYTEDWSNDAEKSALHHWNKLYQEIKSLFKISQYNFFLSK